MRFAIADPPYPGQSAKHYKDHPEYAERFWLKVRRTDGCWLWTAAKINSGYGCFRVAGKTRLAHRLAYELAIGPIEDSVSVLHHCDNPLCVRPDHLFLGDHAANAADMESKGRGRGGFHDGGYIGSAHPGAKLTESDVVEMRQRYARGGVSYRELAADFGVGIPTVAQTIKRKTWRHLP